MIMNKKTTMTPQYKGLGQLLHAVRWSQHFFAILAEILILASFAWSGMDISLGGSMALVPALKTIWAGMFALGVDVMFVLSWVRVRQCYTTGVWSKLCWNILLALGLSFVVFQPVCVQLLQQSLGISFNEALSMLGFNITLLVFARAGIAVFLGAVLAMTNVESALTEQHRTGENRTANRRRMVLFDTLLDRIAPVVTENRLVNFTNFTEQREQNSEQTEQYTEHTEQREQYTEPLDVRMPLTIIPLANTSEQNRRTEQNSKRERVFAVLQENKDATVSEIVNRTGVARSYASTVRSQFLASRREDEVTGTEQSLHPV